MLFNVTNPYSSTKQLADKKSVIKIINRMKQDATSLKLGYLPWYRAKKIILRNKTMLEKYFYDSQCINYVIRPYIK